MKRTVILLLSLLMMAFAAAESPSAFVEGEPHASTLSFRLYFKTMHAELPVGSLSISQRIYSHEEADALLATVRSDLEALAQYTGVPTDDMHPCTVYVVDKLVNGSIERQGSRVYCRAEDVLSGAYRPLLVCAALGTEEYWIGVGLTGCVWGSAIDESSLAAYYAEGSLDVLTLAVPYFLDDFATQEEITLARTTAVAMCRYAMERHGCAALLSDDGVTLRREWLRSLGIMRDFDDPCFSTLRQYRFRASADYSLIAEDPFGNTIYLAPMQDVSSASDLRRFLHDMLTGPQSFFTILENEAPPYADRLQSRYGKLRILCGQNGAWAVPEYREIHLALGSGFMHELGHILLPPAGGANFYTTMWQYEGLCYFLAYQACPSHALRQQYCDALQLFSAMEEPQTANHRFSCFATALYLQSAPLPTTTEAVDAARFAHAMALTPLRHPDLAEGSDWAATIRDSYRGLQNTAGNELTEFQAFSFSAYLIERSGLSAYLDFCTDAGAFEECFGAPYETVREAWLAALNDMFS